MDLRHVRTFVTVADLGTVTRAAANLRVAQPALSRQIADLEHELGLRLFERVGRRLLLSIDGEQLLSDCRGLLNDARALAERAQALRRGDAGTLRLAASPHLIESVFPAFLHRFAQRHPAVQVRLVDRVGPEIPAMLERGEIHVAQVVARSVPPEAQHLESLPIGQTDLLAACRPGLALGRAGSVELAELAGRPLLQITPEFAIRRVFDGACRLAGFEPRIALESRDPHALLAMAEAGHGIAIVPCALRTDPFRLRIVRVTVEGRPLREPLAMVHDRRRPLPAYGRAFCEMLAEHVREVFPITRPTAPARAARGSAGGVSPRAAPGAAPRTARRAAAPSARAASPRSGS